MKTEEAFVNEMEYHKDRFDISEVLARGVSNGHEFIILNLGTHPCSYIKIPKKSSLHNMDYDKIPLNCHGGLTFSGELKGYEGYWIGWDYAHIGDATGYLYGPFDKRWKTEELINEMWNVTYDLMRLREFIGEITKTEEFVKEEKFA